jgi:hypothetical protein
MILGLIFFSSQCLRVQAEEASAEDRMRKDLTYLASDECEGRGVATKGNSLAAEYIAGEFRKAGLKPAGKDGTFFQPFTIKGGVLEGQPSFALVDAAGKTVSLTAGKDYEPAGMSGSGKLEDLPLVFAGFGLTVTKDKMILYDDYQDLDVKDKVVVLLRATPRDESKEGIFGLSGRQKNTLGSLQEKIANAEKHGALGVLFVNDHVTAKDGDVLMPFSMGAVQRTAAKIPVFQLSRAQADQLLQGTGTGLKAREEEIDKELKPASAEIKGWKVRGEIKTTQSIPARNIVGVLEGHGPLANETLVVGAHYDHLGYGGPSSLARLRNPAIHHGADDNGSGSTSIIELARRFGAMKDREGRRLVFIAFSGEELGLFGSVHYCQEPIFPLADTVAMVNLDMVGRLKPDKETGKEKVLVEGSGTAKTFNELLDTLNKNYDFKFTKQASGFGPSDHSSFYEKKIPVIFLWTGDHSDYHRPTDTSDKINYAGMNKIVNFAQEVIQNLSTVKERPEYVKIARAGGGGGGRGGPRIGIAFKEDDKGEGAIVESVIPESPADKAGIKPNDRVVQIADKPVKNAESFLTQSRAAGLKAGEEVTLGVMRGDNRLDLKVTPVRLPTFGIMPDYADDGEGILLSGVADGGAAAKGGLKAGDRILEIGGHAVKNLDRYMDVLYTVKPTQPVEVTVLRDGKKTKLTVTPE